MKAMVVPFLYVARVRDRLFAQQRDGVTEYRSNGVRAHRESTPSLRHSVTPSHSLLSSFNELFTGHLKHGSSGNLIHNANGNLVSTCATSANCPTVCSTCPASYPLTIAGIGGPGPACCISALNGTFTLNRIAGNCQWATGVFFRSGGCSFGWEMFCSKVDCNNVAGPMRWVIAMYGSIGYVWAEMISNTTCPPAGVYTICANQCAGGMGASVVLG